MFKHKFFLFSGFLMYSYLLHSFLFRLRNACKKLLTTTHLVSVIVEHFCQNRMWMEHLYQNQSEHLQLYSFLPRLIGREIHFFRLYFSYRALHSTLTFTIEFSLMLTFTAHTVFTFHDTKIPLLKFL